MVTELVVLRVAAAKSGFRVILSLLVIVSLGLSIIPLQQAQAGQQPWQEYFEFTYGDLPDGWEEIDYTPDTTLGDQWVDIQFLHRDSSSLVPYVAMFVMRYPIANRITMEQCLEGAGRLDDMGDVFWGQPSLRIADASEPVVTREVVGGHEAIVTEVRLEVEERVGGTAEPWDPSAVLPPMHQSDEYEEHWEEHERALTPRAPSSEGDEWEWTGSAWSRTYCVDIWTGTVVIGLAARPDGWWEALEFIDTFEFHAPGASAPLCEEAWRYFGKDALHDLGYTDRASPTNLRRLPDELENQILDAIAQYDASHPGNPAYVSWTVAGTFDAIDWLTTGGGTTQRLTGGLYEGKTWEFVFTDPNAPWPGPPQFGTEAGLYHAMRDKSVAENRRLEPGDVFLLALEHTRGDARQAALLAHNTLRALARFHDESYARGIVRDRSFFTRYLATIRGIPGQEEPEFEGDQVDRFDNSGVWYHMFGTMFFQMQTRGDWGPFAMSLLPMLELGREVDKAILQGHLPDFGLNADDPTYSSRYANAWEQRVRWRDGQEIDPEKFCVNVWGARIGAKVWLSLAAQGRTQLGPAGARQPHRVKELEAALEEIRTLGDPLDWMKKLEAEINPFAPLQSLPPLESISPFYWDALPEPPPTFSFGSPASVIWETTLGTMVLDQRTGGLYGFVPVVLTPVYDEATGTWGAHWFDLNPGPYTLRLVGTDSGSVHLSYFDPASELAATWIARVEDGETLRLDVTRGQVDVPLVRDDGSTIEPIIAPLPSVGATSSLTTSIVWLAVAGVGLLALVTVVGGAAVLWLTGGQAASGRQQAARGTLSPAAAANACSVCGRPSSPTARFCGSCGAPIRTTVAGSAREHCRYCGQPVRPEAAFCRRCGQKTS